jgi:hypothetical protein
VDLSLAHFSRALLVALAAVSCLASCTSKVGSLKVTIVRSPDSADEPLVGVAAFVQLRVDGPDGLVGPVRFPIAAGSGTLTEIPTGSGHVLTVDGLGPEGNGVSRGRTGPLTIEEGENAITLYMGLLERFSQTAKGNSGGPSGALIVGRAFHQAAALPGDRVLLVGGVDDGSWRPGSAPPPKALVQAELLETNSLRFARVECQGSTLSGCPKQGRVGHTLTTLSSGNALLAGGFSGGQDSAALESIEIFDAGTLSFLAGAKLAQVRSGHAAARNGGVVALVGGAIDGLSQVTDAVEFFEGGEVSRRPQLNAARRDFALVRLPDGTLFVSGGFDGQGNALGSTELLKPNAARWTPGPNLAVARGFHTATLLEDGDVVLVGGLSSGGQATAVIERFDNKTNTVREVETLDLARWAHSASRLKDGRILIVGGYTLGVAGSPTRTVEEIKVTETSLTPNTIASMREERAGHSATVLPSGWLLIAGGVTIRCDTQTPPQCTEQPSATGEVFVY